MSKGKNANSLNRLFIMLKYINKYQSQINYDQIPGRYSEYVVVIKIYPGINVSGIAQKLKTNKSNVTPIINALLEKGLILKKKNINDSRVSNLYLTPYGENLIEELSKTRDIAFNQYLSKNFDQKEIRKMEKYSQKIIDILNEKVISDYSDENI